MNVINEPLISVIVPVYNVEQYIDKCINSICNQTYKNLEIILVDDGSTDSSGQKCDEWGKRDYRIKTYHKKNGGLSSARNVGLENVNGEYIGFVDSDDYILPNMYEVLLKLLIKNAVDVARCDFFCTSEKQTQVEDSTIMLLDSEETFLYLARQQKWSVWCNLYTSRVWKNVRFLHGKYYEDALSFPDVILEAHKWVITKKKLYIYNTDNISITRCKMTEKHYSDAIEMVEKLGNYARTLKKDSNTAAYYVWCIWICHFNQILNNQAFPTKRIKQGWYGVNVVLLDLYKKAIKSTEYKELRFRSKLRWLGFRHMPILSQKVFNRLSKTR